MAPHLANPYPGCAIVYFANSQVTVPKFKPQLAWASEAGQGYWVHRPSAGLCLGGQQRALDQKLSAEHASQE